MNGSLILVAVLLLAVVVFLLYRRHRRLLDEAHARFLGRDRLAPTTAPCGRGPTELARLWACPEGDRRNGLEFGVTGPVELEIGGDTVAAECASFVWWWEERRQSTDAKGNRTTSYARRSRIVGMLRVPYWLPSVTIGPEDLVTRLGVGGRGDFQVESEEFNRRFEVRAREGELTVRLLDPGFQRFSSSCSRVARSSSTATSSSSPGTPRARTRSCTATWRSSRAPGVTSSCSRRGSRVPSGGRCTTGIVA